MIFKSPIKVIVLFVFVDRVLLLFHEKGKIEISISLDCNVEITFEIIFILLNYYSDSPFLLKKIDRL